MDHLEFQCYATCIKKSNLKTQINIESNQKSWHCATLLYAWQYPCMVAQPATCTWLNVKLHSKLQMFLSANNILGSSGTKHRKFRFYRVLRANHYTKEPVLLLYRGCIIRLERSKQTIWSHNFDYWHQNTVVSVTLATR